ncbi:MAG: restriction endonuclease subunit S [Candidatus Staskawiczbacteria bacterium]|nr:restriction endonuclease subunit S [Candidatus Staskawiczbacteria bacterium]
MPTATTLKLETKKLPKLRFPGFSDRWQKRKLGEVAKFWNGKAHEQDISENGKYIVVNSKFISQNGQVRKYSDNQSSPLKKGDITIVMSDIPNGKAIGKCFLVDKDGAYSLNQRIGGIKSKEIVSPFLFRIINRNKYFLKFDNGVSQTNLRKNDVSECPVIFPSTDEQQKIADFLSSIDTWIGSLQAQKENFASYKKGIMQKIFSQELRFKDANGNNFPEWEEKQLEDICEYKNGGAFENNLVNNGKYNLINLNSIDITGKLKNNNKTVDHADWYLEKDDLIMVLSDVAHGYFLGLVDIIPENNKYVLNQRMGLLRRKDKNVDIRFLRAYINKNQKYFKLNGQGSSQQNLSKGDILKFKIPTPRFPEQQKIAEFLTSIDKIIESKQQQIIQAEQWKKGLMQGLFV